MTETTAAEGLSLGPCGDADAPEILAVVNDGAEAYRGVIPADRWHEPYMSASELAGEIAAGVGFWGVRADGGLIAVAGVQPVQDVTLIRHAYVRTAWRRRGIGSRLLGLLLDGIDGPVLVGTWAAATWAVRFYERHGFRLLGADEGRALLRRYWSIPERQTETSVVLADGTWPPAGTGLQK